MERNNNEYPILAEMADRFNSSNREVAALVNAALKYLRLLTPENTLIHSKAAFLKLGIATPRRVAEQFLRGREMQLIFESTPGCLLKFNIKFKFKFTKNILTNLLPFPTTYLFESSFSTLLQIKTSSRNKLKVENDLRCALTNTFSCIMFDSRRDRTKIIREVQNLESNQEIKCTEVEEHYTIVEEPGSNYIDHLIPNSGRAQDVAKELISFIHDNRSMESLQALGYERLSNKYRKTFGYYQNNRSCSASSTTVVSLHASFE